MKGKSIDNLREKLLLEYYNLVECFSRKVAKELLPRRPRVDYKIYLKEGSEPSYRKPYLTL